MTMRSFLLLVIGMALGAVAAIACFVMGAPSWPKGITLPRASQVFWIGAQVGGLMPIATEDESSRGSVELDGLWLLCNGQVVSKAEYPELWSAIKDEGDNDTGSFPLPDYRGMRSVSRNFDTLSLARRWRGASRVFTHRDALKVAWWICARSPLQ